ncbi:hypothetical protein [Inquilinus limosus]|uniref:Uncharacterized protein n=1 Tax=Inquilinus limosus MP06 TaxID=1398085 RepID=A0A0A0DCG0_9PROT|nr:hypothetical protein [Inquilinus limosus]KGM35710.1 hypothetical protein P409_03035 [Inquilinus limosus MP06]
MAHAQYSITPITGVDVLQAPSTVLGDFRGVKPATKVTGSNGVSYILALASANIAADTAIIVTAGTGSAAAGAGNYKTKVGEAVTTGQYFWAIGAAT